MIFRVHAETEMGFKLSRELEAGSPAEAANVARKLWDKEGLAVRVVKTKVAKGPVQPVDAG